MFFVCGMHPGTVGLKAAVAHAKSLGSVMFDIKHGTRTREYLQHALICQEDVMQPVPPGRAPMGLNVAVVEFRATVTVDLEDDGFLDMGNVVLDKTYSVQVPAKLLALRGRDALCSHIRTRVNVAKVQHVLWTESTLSRGIFGDAIRAHIASAAANKRSLGTVHDIYDGTRKAVLFALENQPVRLVFVLPWEGLDKGGIEDCSAILHHVLGVCDEDTLDTLPLAFVGLACKGSLSPKWFNRSDLVDVPAC